MELEEVLDEIEKPKFRTDAAGRRLFFPGGTHLPGRVIPDEAAERELRRLLRKQKDVAFWIGPATAFGVIIVLVGSWILRSLVGGWAAVALSGVLILALATVISVPFVVWLLWHQGQVNQLVASWPQVPPLHSRWEAARETLPAGPAWMQAVYLVLSGLFTVGLLAMALLADKPQDRFIGALGAGFFGLAALVFGVSLFLRLARK